MRNSSRVNVIGIYLFLLNLFLLVPAYADAGQKPSVLRESDQLVRRVNSALAERNTTSAFKHYVHLKVSVKPASKEAMVVPIVTGQAEKPKLIAGDCELAIIPANGSQPTFVRPQLRPPLIRDELDRCLNFLEVDRSQLDVNGFEGVAYKVSIEDPVKGPYHIGLIFVRVDERLCFDSEKSKVLTSLLGQSKQSLHVLLSRKESFRTPPPVCEESVGNP